MHIPETSKKNTKNLRSGGLRRNGDNKIQADASYLNMSLCLVVYIIRSTVWLDDYFVSNSSRYFTIFSRIW